MDLTPHEYVVVLFSQSCASWNQTFDDGMGGEAYSRGTSDHGGVTVGRFSDNNAGPVAQAGYMDHRESSSWSGDYRGCGSYAYFSGPAVALGCYPNGERWPLAPELP